MSWYGKGEGAVRITHDDLARFLAANGYADLQALLTGERLEAEVGEQGGLVRLTLPEGAHSYEQPERFLEALLPYAQVGSIFIEEGKYAERSPTRSFADTGAQ